MTEQELQALFDKLRAGVELTNAEMIKLARESGYAAGQMKRMEVGLKDLQANFKKGLDELPTEIGKSVGQTGKAIGGLAKGLGEAETGFRQLNPIIDAAAKAFSGIPILSGAVAAAAEASKFMISQLQNATDAFQEISKVGGLTATGMSGLQRQFLESGMQLKSFTKTIGSNSAALANFAGSVGEGADRFSKTAGTVQKQFGLGLQRLGYGIDEIGETTAAYVAQQTRLGLSQGKSNEALAAGAHRYMLELDELSKLTGSSKEELKKQQDAAMSEARFRAKLDQLVADGKIEEAENLKKTQALISSQNAELGRAFRDAATGFVGTSEEAKRGFMATGGALTDIAKKAETANPVAVLEELRSTVKGTIPGLRSQAMFGNEYAGMYSGLSDFANGIVRDGKKVAETQKTQTEGGDKLTDQTVSAQRNMQQMSIEIQKLGFTYMPEAAAAVNSFTGALNKLLKLVNKEVGGPDVQVGGASGGAGGTVAQKAAARRQAQLERAREQAEQDFINLESGPAFSRPDTTRADKVQMTLDEIRDEIKKLVKLGGVPGIAPGGAPRTGGAAPAAGGAAPAAGGAAPAAGGAPAMTVVPPTSGKIGSVSEKWESGGRGSGVVGWDPGGGTSYGKYQIASKVGSTKAFLNFAEKSGRKDVADKLRAAGFESDTGGTTGKAVDVWKDMAAKGELGDLEHQFIKSQSYDVAFKGLSPEIQKRVEGSKAMQEMLWSSAVHHGGGGKGTHGAAAIFGEAYKEGISDEEFMEKVYAIRGTKFGNQPENIRKSIQNIRFPQELATIKAMRQAEIAGGGAEPTATAMATPTAPAPTTPVSPVLATPTAPAVAPVATPAMTAGLAGQGQNVIASGLQAITTSLFGGGAQGAPGTAAGGGSEVVTLLNQLVSLSRDQNSNLSKILSASTA